MKIIFTISLTANMFLSFLLYGFAYGHLARTIPVPTTGELATQIESDSLTNYHPAKPVHLSRN